MHTGAYLCLSLYIYTAMARQPAALMILQLLLTSSAQHVCGGGHLLQHQAGRVRAPAWLQWPTRAPIGSSSSSHLHPLTGAAL